MENAMKLDKNWYIWLNSVHFLGNPVWWKNTLNKYIYVIGNESSPKAQPHKEKLFLSRSYISNFRQFHCIFHSLGHPVWWKFTLNKGIYVFETRGSQKTPPYKGKQGVLEMDNAMKLSNNWDIWLQSL